MKIIAENCNVFSSSDICSDLSHILEGRNPSQTFLLTDTESWRNCYPVIADVAGIPQDHIIVIDDGDDNKDYRAALRIWEFLSGHGATRRALLINLGGGMPCDLGGFCASTFKRGIEFINIPTTVLSQVDASLGGKTGMNLGALKNEIGCFAMASHVLICGEFLKTLDTANLKAGFAEMIKHALIYKADALERLLSFDFGNVDYDLLHEYVAESIQIKNYFVTEDPKEKGIRKALNFGHTFGHAFETFGMRHGAPILHGYAVAFGMVCELLMSVGKMGLDEKESDRICRRLAEIYDMPTYRQEDYAELVELMRHDKKNGADGINFTLLPSIGNVVVNKIGTPEEIVEIFGKMSKYSVK